MAENEDRAAAAALVDGVNVPARGADAHGRRADDRDMLAEGYGEVDEGAGGVRAALAHAGALRAEVGPAHLGRAHLVVQRDLAGGVAHAPMLSPIALQHIGRNHHRDRTVRRQRRRDIDSPSVPPVDHHEVVQGRVGRREIGERKPTSPSNSSGPFIGLDLERHLAGDGLIVVERHQFVTEIDNPRSGGFGAEDLEADGVGRLRGGVGVQRGGGAKRDGDQGEGEQCALPGGH